MIDERAFLRRNTQHNWNVALTLTKSVRRSLPVDSRKLAERVTKEIGDFLDPALGTHQYLQGAYTIIKRWYFHASTRVPKPSRAYMSKVTGDYVALYWW